MIALQLAHWVHEAGLHGRDLGTLTFTELARALAVRRALSEAQTTCKRVSERRLKVAGMVRGRTGR